MGALKRKPVKLAPLSLPADTSLPSGIEPRSARIAGLAPMPSGSIAFSAAGARAHRVRRHLAQLVGGAVVFAPLDVAEEEDAVAFDRAAERHAVLIPLQL